MELERETDVPACIFRAVIDPTRLAAAVIARVSYDWRGEELIERSDGDHPWEASLAPFESPQGPHPGDDHWVHEGVDTMLFGAARHPGGEARPEGEVALRVGQWERRVKVFGPRTWDKGFGKKASPTRPQPYTEIPLSLAEAYGGSDDLDGLAVPFPDNPEGKGYAIDAKRADGKPLPAFEPADAPLTNWDQPIPVVGFGFCPLAHRGRLERGMEFDEEGVMKALHPAFFNHGFPEMIAPAAAPGDEVVVEGVSAEGPRRFRLPDSRLRVALTFGEKQSEHALRIDQIGLEPDEDRVFITWRYHFRYTMRPLEKRRCVLFRIGEG